MQNQHCFSHRNPMLLFVLFLLFLCFFVVPSSQTSGLMPSFLSVCVRGGACGSCTFWAWSQQLSSLSASLMSLSRLSVSHISATCCRSSCPAEVYCSLAWKLAGWSPWSGGERLSHLVAIWSLLVSPRTWCLGQCCLIS